MKYYLEHDSEGLTLFRYSPAPDWRWAVWHTAKREWIELGQFHAERLLQDPFVDDDIGDEAAAELMSRPSLLYSARPAEGG